jgi:E3 ubiquitin-protein ligase HUWE1
MIKLFNARRQLEGPQRQQFFDSASVIADVLVQHLAKKEFGKFQSNRNIVNETELPTGDNLSSHAYNTVMLGLAVLLLVDGKLSVIVRVNYVDSPMSERPSQSSLNTILLFSFFRAGGLNAVLDICSEFIISLEKLSSITDDARSEVQKQELVHAYSGLKVALRLLEPLVSVKPLMESAQTPLVLTSNKNETDPAYFEPHNFIVKLRALILPTVRSMWESSWLPQIPVGVSRSIVLVVLELANGEGEEAGAGSITPVVPPPAPAGPDENRIRQLTEMGFPRSAAERALIRMHNNVAAATELLLAQPFPLQPDPEPAQEPLAEDTDMATSDEQEGDETSTSSAMERSTPPAAHPLPEQASEPIVAEGKSAEEWRKELAQLRGPLRDSIGKVALRLVDEQPSLIFDIQNAFVGTNSDYQAQSIRQLVSDIKEFQSTAYDVHEQPMAIRFRLLALVMNNSSRPTDFLGNEGKHLMDVLLALLLSNPIALDVEHPTLPKWLAAQMLVTESLLTAGEDIRSITLPRSENDLVQKEELLTGPAYPEARRFWFDFCLRLLAVPQLPRDEVLASLRLVVFLTRNHPMAYEFIGCGGLPLLFRHQKSSLSEGDLAAKSYISLIIRHAVEEPRILQQTMQREIKRFMSHPKSRFPDPSHYVRDCSAAALRDPLAFIQATETLCQLQRPFSGSRQISLKKEEKTLASSGSPANTDMQVDVDGPVPTASTALEEVVHFLVAELIQVVKPIDTSVQTALVEPASMSDMITHTPALGISDAPQTASTSKAELDVSYPCFLMQSLTELLFSYDSCKLAFLSYSPKRRTQTPSKEHLNKHRTAALYFFLYDLVSFGSISSPTDAEGRKRVTLCNWAMSVIVALCVNSSSSNDLKDVPDDLVSVRKFVLDAISRIFKESLPSDTTDGRYGRLLALSELCHRLLTVRFNSSTRKVPEDSPTHIAKVMLEKNFVAHLTNALGEIDLNYPNVRGLVSALLKPEQLLFVIYLITSYPELTVYDQDKDSNQDEPLFR